MKKIIKWIIRLFWEIPTQRPRAAEVVNNYVVISYKGQRINLRKSEIPAWNALARKDRRAMALKFKNMEKSGKIRFVKINGRLTCVYNRDYEARARRAKI